MSPAYWRIALPTRTHPAVIDLDSNEQLLQLAASFRLKADQMVHWGTASDLKSGVENIEKLFLGAIRSHLGKHAHSLGNHA